MNKKQSVACLGLCAMAGFGLYLRDRPHVSTANLQELTAVSPSTLVNTSPKDPQARKRYDQLVALAVKFDEGPSISLHKPSAAREDLPYYEASTLGLLKAGPMERDESRGDDYSNELKPLASLATAISNDAKSTLKAGNPARSADLLATLVGFATAIKQAGGTHVVYLVMSALDNIATDTVMKCVRDGHIRPAELKRLLVTLPPGAPGDRVLADDWATDYRANVLPMLTDFNVVRQRIALIHREDYSPGQPVVGCYDAVETTKLLGAIYQLGQKNALADWKHQDNSGDKIVETQFRRVPLSGARPADNWANKMLFDVEMNTTPNSIGSELVGQAGFGQTEIKRASVTTATRYELTRAVVALRLYALEHGGTSPTSLSDLVKCGELPSPPMDCFQLQPLKYDRHRNLVYALGPLGVDESAKLRADGWTQNRTLGFFVGRPN